jgi:uncharacterized protein YkwD
MTQRVAVATLALLSLSVASSAEAQPRTKSSKTRRVTTRTVVVTTPPTTAAPQFVGESNSPTDADAAEIFSLVNRERAAAGLPPFTWDPHLAAMATDWSTNMSSQGFRHRDNSTVSLPASVTYRGENIAWGLRTPIVGLHQGLMDSPGHRANLLSTSSNRIGIGVVKVGEETWVTQNFGTNA